MFLELAVVMLSEAMVFLLVIMEIRRRHMEEIRSYEVLLKISEQGNFAPQQTDTDQAS